MKPTELKRRIAREATRQIEQRGFTRKRIEQHIRKMLRPRPRWVPKALWTAIAAIVIRGTGELEQAELDQAERELLDAIVGCPRAQYDEFLEVIEPLIARVRSLRARQSQDPA